MNKLFSGLLTIFILYLAGCDMGKNVYKVDYNDSHSFAHPKDAVVKHLDLDLNVDFSAKKLSGKVSLLFDNTGHVSELHLDTRDLNIQEVTMGEDNEPTTFRLGDEVAYLGQPLVINITPTTKRVNIRYETSPGAAALQWLTPEQTAGGKQPFLFTQSQAILARTWIPCQDSPGIRITYSARIQTEPQLMAVMSAENPTEKSSDGVYNFTMKQPIPSYLLALAIGDLQFSSLGERSGVYAEPSVIDKAAFEFSDTEKMIAAAEKLYGPYRWDRYDIIVLPPSFPFGGMENPRLTFATPTILAGDKSLVALVAHELAHSWSGNLVTNANWNDFWLNEGFTTYFEHRIMEEVYGVQYADMLAVLSFHDLQKTLTQTGPEHEDTHLFLNLGGRDPDDGMTAIAYDKGHFFLRTLEKAAGREKWDAFLRSYFDKFAFTSMTTEVFLSYLKKALFTTQTQQTEARLDAWVYGPGVPDNAALSESEEFSKVESEMQKWLAGAAANSITTTDWTTHHWLHFLRSLPQGLSKNQMLALDNAFKLSKSGNSEIMHAWLLHVVANKYDRGYAALEHFLTSMGRRKFLKPLYTQMMKTPGMVQMAKLIYSKARASYHPISVTTIDEILSWGI